VGLRNTRHQARQIKKGNNSNNNILSLMNFLRFIYNHGPDLLPAKAGAAWKKGNASCLCMKMLQDSDSTCRVRGREVEGTGLSLVVSDSLSEDLCCEICLSREARLKSRPKNPIARLDSRTSNPSAKLEALIRNLLAEQAVEGNAKPIKK
jgi:hypothetical protein